MMARYGDVAAVAVVAIAGLLTVAGGAAAREPATAPRAPIAASARASAFEHLTFLPLVLDAADRIPAATARATTAASTTASPLATADATPSGATATPTDAPADPTVPPEPTPSGTASQAPPLGTATSTPEGCAPPPPFHAGLVPARTVWIAQDGDDQAGDGSPGRPFATLRRAAREAAPGTALRLRPGRYAGGTYLDDLAGTAGAPIWIGGDPGGGMPDGPDGVVLEGASEGLHLARARFVVVHDLTVQGASGNGINADDGGEVDGPPTSHDLVFERVTIRAIGGTGNQDCLKLSGLRDVVVADSTFERCGGGGSGSGIDMVGVHRARIHGNRFTDMSGNAVQAKGGSTDIEIRANRMLRAGARAVNMGGSTGLQFFRPPLDPAAENAEARDVRVVANLIEGSQAPVAFVGCVGCLAANNTLIEPETWVLRILQETTTGGGFSFSPARDGRFVNNLIVFRRGQLRTTANVGGGTAPETFTFASNLWYASDAPERSAPELPVAETGAVIGRDPRLGPDGAIGAGSPAAGAGVRVPEVGGDLTGRCYADPPSIGAREVDG